MKNPEYHRQDDYLKRKEKLLELKKAGINPYPHKFHLLSSNQELEEQYKSDSVGHSDDAAAGSTPKACAAGRVVLFRSMGKNSFGHIQDSTGRIQLMLNRELTKLSGFDPEKLEEEITDYKFIEKKIDIGDIIGVEGHLFRTQKGELTIFVKQLTFLSKSLLPLADKHGGLADKELRYRKRWLDLISHMEVTNTFKTRSQILETIRDYFRQHHFMEVETPVLQGIYGGAEAKPFITKLNAMDQEMFLRISLEIPLKKLIVGGLPRIYELGKVFRNEGIDKDHNPEFTLLEAYASYWDYKDMMSFVEKLFEAISLKVYGSTKIPYQTTIDGEVTYLDMQAPWKKMTMKESILHYANIKVDDLSDKEMVTLLKESGRIDLKKVSTLSRGLLIAALFEVFVEHHLIQPHHIIDHPIETTPLCKPHRDPLSASEGLVERFESFIACKEICNSYSELNDPILQRELLEAQQLRKDMGDEEASPLDEEFMEAICQGMPPTGGIGIGIDRLVMLFTNSHSIRDVLYFPWMKKEG